MLLSQRARQSLSACAIKGSVGSALLKTWAQSSPRSNRSTACLIRATETLSRRSLGATSRRATPFSRRSRKRFVVFLRYFADLSYPEIADVVGISEGTVAATLHQARVALHEALTEGVTSSGSR